MPNLPSINPRMVKLNLPQYPLRIKHSADKQLVFDQIRKKHIILTPEEWVRQHFVNYLIHDLQYPKSLVKIESGLTVNKMGKRTDILVYNHDIEPHLLVECKAAQVNLNHETLEQLATYNRTIKAKYLVLTNGLKHYCCGMDYDLGSYQFQSTIPQFKPVKSPKTKNN